MTQKEFEWGLASLEATVRRIALITRTERQLLLGLVRFYWQQREAGADLPEHNGAIAVMPTKADIASLCGCSVETVKRRLRALRAAQAAVENEFCAVTSIPGHPHCYWLNFPAIFAAPLLPEQHSGGSGGVKGGQRTQLPQAPTFATSITSNEGGQNSRGGSGGVKGGQRTQLQTGRRHTGEKPASRGGSEFAPYHTNHHSSPNNKTTIGGHGVLNFSFFELRAEEFRSADAIAFRFQEVTEAGLLKDCIVDRLAFFALMIHLGRSKSARNPAGLLTTLLRDGVDHRGTPWRQRPTQADEDAARQMIRRQERNATEPQPAHPDDEWSDEDLYAPEEADEPTDDLRTCEPEEPAEKPTSLPEDQVRLLRIAQQKWKEKSSR